MSSRINKDFWIGLAIFIGMLQSATAGSILPTPELRLADTYQEGSDIRLFAAAWYIEAPAWIRASRMEIAVGLLDGSGPARPFASVGPVWRLNRAQTPIFVEFGFSPTALGGSTLGNHELGGNLHFTSSLALGRDFHQGPLARVALRVSHLSNGGLRDDNPGLDLIGLSFIGRFGSP
jgi:hypothetical protein